MYLRFLNIVVLLIVVPLGHATKISQLKVCADPANLPYSDRAGQGYENRIAELLAKNLHRKLVYQWSRMGRGFVRDVLNSGECDVLIEVPRNFTPVLPTPSYFTSTYVFVTRKDSKLNPTSFDDPVMRQLRIGVQMLGDDYASPGHSLTRRGMVKNLVGFESVGPQAENIINAVARRKIDIAIVWGPVAGYFAKKQKERLTLTPVPAFDAEIPFRYEMSMAVRKGNGVLRDQLTDFLSADQRQIIRVLRKYGVPLLDFPATNESAKGGN